jgi:hypothetical protein
LLWGERSSKDTLQLFPLSAVANAKKRPTPNKVNQQSTTEESPSKNLGAQFLEQEFLSEIKTGIDSCDSCRILKIRKIRKNPLRIPGTGIPDSGN